MGISVRRAAEGRRLAAEVSALARQERQVQTRLTEARLRVDSLASRARILEVAADLGLRPPDDEAVKFLPDVAMAGRGAGSARGRQDRQGGQEGSR